jgi:uncharacterized membrane protein
MFGFGGFVNGFVTGRLMKIYKVHNVRVAWAFASLVLPSLVVVVFSAVDLIEYF